MNRKFIAIIGAGNAEKSILKIAEEVGGIVAKNDSILVCGGLGGVMEWAAKGAKQAGGTTIGILPNDNKLSANLYIDIPIATGFGEGRNVIIARTADAIIAIGGEYGTLSEIAFGLKMNKPVVGIRTWEIQGVINATNATDAVAKVFERLNAR